MPISHLPGCMHHTHTFITVYGGGSTGGGEANLHCGGGMMGGEDRGVGLFCGGWYDAAYYA